MFNVNFTKLQQELPFKGNSCCNDKKYKQVLIDEIQSNYQFTPKFESLDSIVGPDEFKRNLNLYKREDFILGPRDDNSFRSSNEFDNVKKAKFRINLHTHTKHSDGSMSIDDYLNQSIKYADKVARYNNDNLPPYTSAITDHNNFDGVKEVIARIADEPQKYKNFKFVPGCEFMFLDDESGFKYPAFEALGYCFNPFDKELIGKISKFNSVDLVPKIKEFGGVVSYAHPIRYCQGNGVEPKFIEYLKSKGVDGIESNYQYVTIKNTKELRDAIEECQELAIKNKFYQTGGTDTHSKNIFSIGVGNNLDTLI